MLALDSAERTPWLDWSQWFAANGVPDLAPAHTVRLSHYDQLIRAAVDGDGVALGRTPLIERYLATGKLVAPLRGRAASPRNYFLVGRQDQPATPAVKSFVAWMTALARDEKRGDPV